MKKMKKTNFLLILVALTMSSMAQTISTTWQITAAANSYLGEATGGTNADKCRSICYGVLGTTPVVVVASRVDVNLIRVLNASDGTFLQNMDITGVSGGSHAVSDPQITEDNILLCSNLAEGSANGLFKVYQWDNLSAVPTTAISYQLSSSEGSRYGDNITVTGRISDGTAKVYAASSYIKTTGNLQKIARWSMIPDIANPGKYKFDSANPTISSAIVNTNDAYQFVSLCPLPNGKFLYKGIKSDIILLNSDLTLASPASSFNEGTTNQTEKTARSLKFLKTVGTSSYVACYNYGPMDAGHTRNFAYVLKFDNYDLSTTTQISTLKSPSLGTTKNGGDNGRVSIENSADGDFMYVLSTNNGIGKFKINDLTTSVEQANTLEIKVVNSVGSVKVLGINASSISLFNSLGQKVKSVTNSNEMLTGNLKGVYIIQVKVADQVVKTDKIIIR